MPTSLIRQYLLSHNQLPLVGESADRGCILHNMQKFRFGNVLQDIDITAIIVPEIDIISVIIPDHVFVHAVLEYFSPETRYPIHLCFC